MQITLRIDNVDRLETGGQVSYSCSDRGFDIGRHEHLDWSLPDPQRVISGKHCEVRFEGGRFVLYDVSTNGTFVNGSPNRMDKPHVLKSGDRFMIGDYIISVAVEGSMAAHEAAPAGGAVGSSAGPWASPLDTGAQSASQQAGGWPAGAPAQQPAYPVAERQSPWDAPSPGMEGRHAPPSSTPGIGTPADDVWSQQGHGWGTADPGLYSPQQDSPERLAPRPAQADPLDHLAPQPHLQPKQSASPFPLPEDNGSSGPEAVPAAPRLSQEAQSDSPGSGFDPDGGAPLFGMPDLGSPDSATIRTEAVDAIPSEPMAPGGPAPVAPPPPSIPQDVAGGAAPTPVPASGGSDPQLLKSGHGDVFPANASEPGPSAISAPVPQGPETTSKVSAPAPAALDDPTGPAASTRPDEGVEFLKAFAEGAGIPVSALEGRTAETLAREVGEILAGVTGDLMGLLAARSQVKAMTRNANRTMISRSGNNALKFSPTPQMALQTMLAANAEDNGYLPFCKAMSAAFKDIQKHHVWTYSAMQKAAARFEKTLSPKAIEAEGLVQKSTFGNLKAKQWEKLEERWASLVSAHDDGLVGVFTQYFTENYEDLSRADDGEGPGI